MTATIQKRMTGRIEGEFVVLLIGMRINRWWKIWQWLRVALGMQRMLRELEARPELGYLGGDGWFARTTMMVTYWRSMDQLMAYAHDRAAAHLPAWRAFNKMVGTSGDVGIWHETYRVRPGDYESVYVNMPTFGISKVGQSVEATGRRESATGRLREGAAA
jgi:hypothetical protein